MLLGLGFVNGPDDTGYQQEYVDNLTRVERHAQSVDEEQLKPSADGDDAWYDAIEYGGQDNHRDTQGYQRTLEVGIGELAVVINQSDGGQTKQVQQVDTNGETCHVHDQYQPTVAVRLVGLVFPFQDEPEHYSRKGGGVSIDLTLDSREPEGVAEGIEERSHKSGSLDGYQFRQSDILESVYQQSAYQMGDAPEKEQDTCGRKKGTHDVDHLCHLCGIAGKL